MSDRITPATLEVLTALTSPKAPPYLAWILLFRLLLGGILVVAASLKCYGAWRGYPLQMPLLRSVPAQIALVEVELILGTWLICGIAPRWAYVAAGAAFAAFLAAASYEVVLRARSCGCFGPVPVDPKVTAALDALALAVLLIFRRAFQSDRGIPRTASWLTMVAGACLALSAPMIMLHRTAAPATGSIIFLEPATWVGKPFPLESYVNDGGQLTKGNWLVMLYRHDCPSCEQAMPAYLELARRISAKQNRPAKLAFIELPPYGPGVSHDSHAHWFAMAAGKEWAGATPIDVVLGDGNVESVAQGEAAIAPPAAIEHWIDGGQ